MKHVNAYPFVGKDYEKGFLNSGKKVLLLGLSHYNEENAGAPCHHTFTQEIVDGFVSGEDASFYRGYTSQTKALLNREISVDDRECVWNQLAFYNFIQFNIARPGVKDTSDEFNSSVSAFKEILEELKPDVIITWVMVSSIDFILLARKMVRNCFWLMVMRLILVGLALAAKIRLL